MAVAAVARGESQRDSAAPSAALSGSRETARGMEAATGRARSRPWGTVRAAGAGARRQTAACARSRRAVGTARARARHAGACVLTETGDGTATVCAPLTDRYWLEPALAAVALANYTEWPSAATLSASGCQAPIIEAAIATLVVLAGAEVEAGVPVLPAGMPEQSVPGDRPTNDVPHFSVVWVQAGFAGEVVLALVRARTALSAQ